VRTGGSRRAFFDANILIYAEDAGNPRKQAIAADLLEENAFRQALVVSVPVLGEYFSVATRKLGVDPVIARTQVEYYSMFSLVEPVLPDVLAAIDIHRLYGFQYFDALHLHCARRAGCSVFYSEDMHHGQMIDGVRIVNPFL
jgi:predicted nucleic acid-binding protein